MPPQIESVPTSKALVWIKYILVLLFVCFAVLHLSDYFWDRGVVNNVTALDPMIVEQSNWKTYRNEEHGVEFKYPENLKINNNPAGFIGDAITFEDESGERFFSFGSAPLDYLENLGLGWDRYMTERKINGIKVMYSNYEGAVAWFFGKKSLFDLNKYSSIDLDNFEKILSTFKFISTSTPSE